MEWLKALHIIFMVMWFAGLFYLPRLFVYHADANDQVSVERFKIMERKLFVIMTIGAVGTAVLGFWMLFAYAWDAYKSAIWLHLKVLMALLLLAYHAWLGILVKRFAIDQNTRSHKFYRGINEIPVLFLFGMVILVVVKPF